MSDESKLGLVAGVLAVVGVAVFGLPHEKPSAKPEAAISSPNAANPPALPPAAVNISAVR